MTPRLTTRLTTALVVVLALLYLWVGVTAQGWDRASGVGGGALVLAAPIVATRSRSLALVALVVGAVPLAVGTWWSIVTPLLAILVVLIGMVAIRSVGRRVVVPVTTSPGVEAR